jgi:hypothetical protein
VVLEVDRGRVVLDNADDLCTVNDCDDAGGADGPISINV